MIHEKKPEAKNLVTLSLYQVSAFFGQVPESPGTAVAAGGAAGAPQAALPAPGQQDKPHPPRTVPAH